MLVFSTRLHSECGCVCSGGGVGGGYFCLLGGGDVYFWVSLRVGVRVLWVWDFYLWVIHSVFLDACL